MSSLVSSSFSSPFFSSSAGGTESAAADSDSPVLAYSLGGYAAAELAEVHLVDHACLVVDGALPFVVLGELCLGVILGGVI